MVDQAVGGADAEFELEMVRADPDWTGTRVSLRLEPRDGATWVRFSHTGWPAANEHYRISQLLGDVSPDSAAFARAR